MLLRPIPWVPILLAGIVAAIQFFNSSSTMAERIPESGLTFFITWLFFWALHIQIGQRPIVARLFLCRFPFVCGLTLIVLPIAALTFARPFLGSLFVMTTFQIGVVAFLALLAGWAVMITFTVIREYATKRFGPDQIERWDGFKTED